MFTWETSIITVYVYLSKMSCMFSHHLPYLPTHRCTQREMDTERKRQTQLCCNSRYVLNIPVLLNQALHTALHKWTTMEFECITHTYSHLAWTWNIQLDSCGSIQHLGVGLIWFGLIGADRKCTEIHACLYLQTNRWITPFAHHACWASGQVKRKHIFSILYFWGALCVT